MTTVLRGDPFGWSLDRRSAVTIGVFDGVHLGHRRVLADIATRAADEGWVAVALTFDPHPLEILSNLEAPELITGLDHRVELLGAAGAEVVGVLPFLDIRDLPAPVFAKEILGRGLGAELVAVGDDFRFGVNRTGDIDTLRAVGAEAGFRVESVRMVGEEGGEVVSSTRIRGLISQGRVVEAGILLGRPFELRGVVMRGEGRGGTIGFPTANVHVASHLLAPGNGVYAAQVTVAGVPHAAVVNVGVRPTFGGTVRMVEAHLLDFEGDLYGLEVSVGFVDRLRDERRFDGVDALVAQIRLDVAEARSRLE